MLIERILVKNFRSIEDAALPCENLTALLGANGSGKSSFLRALELFFDASPKITEDDFYNRDISRKIEISVSFNQLPKEALELFSAYLQEDSLTLTVLISCDSGNYKGTIHGSKMEHPDFAAVRAASTAADKKTEYLNLKQSQEFATLPGWSKTDTALSALEEWERANPDKCSLMRDDGQFFGFKGVGRGHLNKFIRFLAIPAVRDAAEDAEEGKGSVITTLMDLLVRSTFASKSEFETLRTDFQKKYEDLVKAEDLKHLETAVNETLSSFAPDSSVKLAWRELGELEIPTPRADVRLSENGFSACVGHTGHGVQRAFIFSVLQQLARAQITTGKINNGTASGYTDNGKQHFPTLILAIEEPELYQHPNRQRHIAKILLQLASGVTPGVADKTQVIYSTHAPLLVGIDRFDQIRIIRKVPKDHGPQIAKVHHATLDHIAEIIWSSQGSRGQKFTGTTLKPRLAALMTPWMREGFFAASVVLVEGEEDRAVLLGAAYESGMDLERSGISVLPCGGKPSLDRPTAIFRELGIPVYVMWDSDKDKNQPEVNRSLLRLMGATEEDYPSGVFDSYSCFESNLTQMLKTEFGAEDYESMCNECSSELQMNRSDASKNPVFCQRLFEKASQKGIESKTVKEILKRVAKLADKSAEFIDAETL